MRAVITPGDGSLRIEERPMPDPGPGEVRVRTHGAGLNRADLIQRIGLYPAPPGAPADIPGLEFAGVVDALGPGVEGLEPGDRVAGIVAGGGQAEYLCVHASHCIPVAETLDLVTFGGVPEAFLTAHDAMITQAGLRAGEWMLVHAVGSGVGTAALQLASALGAHTVGTARSADKLERCRALGLEVAVTTPLEADGGIDVAAATATVQAAVPTGIDVTLDLVGGRYAELDVALAAPLGRIVLIGTLAGGSARLALLSVMSKRLTIRGTVLRGRTVTEKADATGAFVADVLPLLQSARVEPVVEAVLPLADAADAYGLLASDTTFGKVILDLRD